MHYIGGDFRRSGALSAARRPGSTEIDSAGGVLFYLAIPPGAYANVIEQLGAAGLPTAAAPDGWRRIIVEKPFGTDLATARELNRIVHRHFDEEQVFRIDHYLGKETVQNLLVFRFANGMFEPVWNRRYIDHVQITAAETVGVERRAAYYEGAGALRDMVQNHLMQLLALVAMEPPIAFTAESVRDRKMDALLSVQPLVDGTGRQRRARAVSRRAGWRAPKCRRIAQEPGVAPASTTETFVALRMQLDSWRWAGVPFYLRTGKRLPKRTTEIAIQFRRPPLQIFKRVSHVVGRAEPAHHQRAARRGDLGALRGQAAGDAHAARAGDDELPLRHRVRRLGSGGVRDAAARRDARRPDAVRAPRFRRGVVGADHAGPRAVAGEARSPTCRSTRPASGDRPEADALIERDGRRWRTL